MTQWKPIFTGMVGMRQVQVEIADSGLYRVKTLHRGTEVTLQVQGDTPGDLEQNLRERGLFSDSEAREIAHKIVYR